MPLLLPVVRSPRGHVVMEYDGRLTTRRSDLVPAWRYGHDRQSAVHSVSRANNAHVTMPANHPSAQPNVLHLEPALNFWHNRLRERSTVPALAGASTLLFDDSGSSMSRSWSSMVRKLAEHTW